MENAGKHGRIYAFDFMRAYFCLMIILLHVESAWKADSFGGVAYYEMRSVRVAFNSAVVTVLVRTAVPIFFMISGALFLNPSNDVSLSTISQHIRKILTPLCLFGYLFALMEIVFVNRRLGVSDFGAAFLNLLQEETWAHLWFLYAMIGLYLLTPVLRAWIRNASSRELWAGVLVSLILLSVIPTVNDCTGLDITTFRILSPGGGVLCYLAGYFLSASSSTPPHAQKCTVNSAILIVSAICTGIFGYLDFKHVTLYRIWSPYHTWIFLFAAEVFYFLTRSEWVNRAGKHPLIQKLSRYSLSVYIIHPVFLNALYKGLHFFPDRFPPIVGELLIWASVSALAIASSAVLLKIPILKKYL